MSLIQGFRTPPRQLEMKFAAMVSGAIGGAVLAALLTDDETKARYLKIAGGVVAGLLAGFGTPPPFDPRKY